MPGPSTSQPMHTSSRSASGKRQSNDFWEGFKNFYQEISSSKKQKETCSASEKHDPDPEYEALMKELLEGGVDPKSKEYFMASEVLLDIHRRGAYRPLPDIEAKLLWIKRVYHRMEGHPLS
ncbi:hypothetical protein U9M48_004736 [Paspalum notatum var. saurae]|uniref:Uncharacterized protein n=1 Tax=Paspalum notatum var. saurae TaxID=547442 RepID=A0AAQ3PTW5_PASNO